MSLPPESRLPPQGRETYGTLDGLRGVAALAVVLYHFASDVVMVHGYLAVDLFFGMSGLVIASAYEARLRGGLKPLAFGAIRVRRLAPLWLLGMGLALVLETLVPTPPAERTLWLVALGALLIPSDGTFVGAFPMNQPFWSLHVELVVNLVYAWSCRWLTSARLLAIAGVSFAALVAISYANGAMSSGTSELDMLGGYLRALTSFSLGVVIWRFRSRLPKLPLSPISLLAAAFLALTGLGLDSHGVLGVSYDLAFVALGVPLLLCAALSREPSARLRPFFLRMGSGSYALYAIHQPFIEAARRFASDHGGVPAYLGIELALLPGLVLMAWGADRLYDVPVRQWLGRLARRPARRVSAQPAR